MSNLKDLTGQRFGRLIVIEYYGNSKWICKCDCGNITKPIQGCALKSKRTKSCGCLQKERVSKTSSKRMKERWQDENYKKELSKRSKKMWQDDKYRDKMKKSVKKQWEDKEFRNMMSEKRIEMNKERWNDEHKQKHSEIMKERWQDEEYRKTHSGTNHHNYKKELTDEDRQDRRLIEGYDEWRYKVKEKANFTCDCCGDNKGGNLVSHHLESYNNNKELRTKLSNGVCLCEKCHKEFHKIYGQGNNTKEQYIEFKERKQKGDEEW